MTLPVCSVDRFPHEHIPEPEEKEDGEKSKERVTGLDLSERSESRNCSQSYRKADKEPTKAREMIYNMKRCFGMRLGFSEKGWNFF